MSRAKFVLLFFGGLIAAALCTLGLAPASAHPGHEADAEFRALLFTKTAAGAYRHDSIDEGVAMFQQLATDEHFELVHTEDAAIFNDADLATFDVVIMFQNGGMVWDTDAQRQAVQTYVNNGGGIAAIHNATDMNIEQEFPWWDNLINAGSHMPTHSPGVLHGTAKVLDDQHASTAGLPDRWERDEEWYNFKPSLRGKVHVLVQADEKTYNPGPDAMGYDHPISWCRDAEGGRVWATGMGHAAGSYSEPLFKQHLLGGIKTAAGVVPANCTATVDSAFEKVALDSNTKAPTTLDVAPDGRVFYTEILGQLKVYDPETNATTTALDIPVYSGGEDGLIGVAVAPDFATTGHLYLNYSPPGTEEINRVSRFTVAGSTIDRATEVKIIDIPASRREEPGHTGGYLDFGPGGNLYIGVGDDTNPFQSSGYAPIDERPGRDLFDAQKTSANTNDPRGKILRITPKAEGGYDVPAGNMFAPGTEKTRPEIYAMGFRNPYRFSVASDGTVYLADYGPDSSTANPNRGPDGKVEWNVIKTPGYYGWPYCIANNIAYNDFDFATNTSGPKFDCNNPVNTSPNNTGLTQLPAARPADVWYGYGASAEFPEFQTGGAAPMAGPVYEFDPNLVSDTKFPEYYDGKPFFYEWARNRLFNFSLDGEGKILKVDPWFTSATYLAPMDMKFGPDGSMYLLEWGGGYGRDNPDSGLYRIDYTQGNRRPVAKATATPSSGISPLAVEFSSEGSADPEGTPLTYSWTFGDGGTSTEANPSHTYDANGQYNVQLTVTDETGKTGVANVTVTVGNTAPTVDLTGPVDGGFFDFGDKVDFDLDVTDPEDGTVDCAKVVVQPALGHDAHAHPLDPVNACQGTLSTIVDEGHADANIFYSVDASYTDNGANGQPALTGRDLAVLQPKHKQAEYFTGSSGIRIVEQAGAEGGKRIGDISNNDWISFKPVNLQGIDQVSLRASSGGGGGTVELHAGATDGPLVASVNVPNTGGWNNYVTLPPVDVTDPGGTTELFVVFKSAAAGPYDLDAITFIGKGVSQNAAPYVTATATPTGGSAPLDVAFSATATDPEGDTPISFAWDFGDGGTGTGAVPTHTYTTGGTFTAAVTATDSAGRAKTAKVTVVVTPKVTPPVQCLSPGSDEFGGDALDRNIWKTVRPADANYQVTGGALVLPTAAGDINEGSTGPISFVGQPAAAGAWAATTLVDINATEQWQQAGILLWANDDNYVRVNVQSNGSGRELEFVSETNGARTIRKGTAPAGTRFHLRLESDGTVLRAFTSADGQTWTAYGDTFPLPSGAASYGPYALKGTTPAPEIDATFHYFYVTGQPAGEVDRNDEFAGDRLDGCRWNAIVRPDFAGMRVEGGELRVDTLPGDINGGNNNDPKNFVLQAAPDGDWTAETRFKAPLKEKYQLAGFMVYGNDDDYVKLDVVAVNDPGSAVSLRAELVAENDGQFGNGGNRSIALTDTESGWWYLRLTKTGDSYAGWVSEDGEEWHSIGDPVTNQVPEPKVGLQAIGPDQTQGPVTVGFDWFHLTLPQVDETAPVTTATIAPAEPDGSNGWWRTAPTVTLAAVDEVGGSGVAGTEYRIGAGDWTAYTTPFPVTGDGERTVEFRSTDLAGNAEQAGSVTVKVDSTAPVVQVGGVQPGASYGDSTDLTLGFAGTDATSGLQAVTAVLDGTPLPAGALALHMVPLGQHTLVVTGTDKAGNTATRTITFSVATSFADVARLIDRFVAEARLSPVVAAELKQELVRAEWFAARSQDSAAIRELQVFVREVNKRVTDTGVATVMRRDANALIAGLR
ncbi:MAG: ThuA domain-containing protein [Kribbellaceae bacterium]